jgi:hypothetical protein
MELNESKHYTRLNNQYRLAASFKWYHWIFNYRGADLEHYILACWYKDTLIDLQDQTISWSSWKQLTEIGHYLEKKGYLWVLDL